MSVKFFFFFFYNFDQRVCGVAVTAPCTLAASLLSASLLSASSLLFLWSNVQTFSAISKYSN